VKTAVVVTTYNRPDALEAVLAGYQAQRDTGFELVIADDGSTAATRELVEAFKTRAGFPVKHVWHEDNGFRAAAIRNRALAATSADYVIFSDGDCVPAPYFVAQHRRLAEPGWFVAGNRALLSAAFTERVLREKIAIHAWTRADWWLAWAAARHQSMAAAGDPARRQFPQILAAAVGRRQNLQSRGVARGSAARQRAR
jgi:glycosyltransferase involved in cell wall biosynthesis